MWIAANTNMTIQDLSHLLRPAPYYHAPAALLEFARSTIPAPIINPDLAPRAGMVEFGIEAGLLKHMLAPIVEIKTSSDDRDLSFLSNKFLTKS
jgi:hypothetical protein